MTPGNINDENKSAEYHSENVPSASIDRYKKYLAEEGVLENVFRNPRNLFHAQNSTDTLWLNVARINLARAK